MQQVGFTDNADEAIAVNNWHGADASSGKDRGDFVDLGIRRNRDGWRSHDVYGFHRIAPCLRRQCCAAVINK
jgi:hypothetical protein